MKTSDVTLKNTEKIELIMNISTMISAGISLLAVIDSLLEDAKGNQKIVLQTLHDDVVQGRHVYASFSKFPLVFDKVSINIIKAAEESGTLDVVLKDLKDNIRKNMEFADKIKAALTYPVIISLVFVGVLIMLLIVVIPKISQVFSQMNVPLPLPTKILIFMSDMLVKNTIPLFIVLIILGGTIYYIYKKHRKLILNPLYSLPVISPLIREIDFTRFTYNLYLLLNSGLTITSALELTQDVVVKEEVFHIIKRSRSMVNAGKNLSDGLKTGKKIIPTIMIKLIEAGEKSGSLDKSLKEVSEYLDYEVDSMLKTATALLEPVMLIVVGISVGGMMLSIIGPMYGLISQVGTR